MGVACLKFHGETFAGSCKIVKVSPSKISHYTVCVNASVQIFIRNDIILFRGAWHWILVAVYPQSEL